MEQTKWNCIIFFTKLKLTDIIDTIFFILVFFKLFSAMCSDWKFVYFFSADGRSISACLLNDDNKSWKNTEKPSLRFLWMWLRKIKARVL